MNGECEQNPKLGLMVRVTPMATVQALGLETTGATVLSILALYYCVVGPPEYTSRSRRILQEQQGPTLQLVFRPAIPPMG